jgi:hypothetical protein
MTLRIVLPSVNSVTLGLARAADLTSSSVASLGRVRRSRSLPLIWMMYSISLRTRAAGS